MTSKFDCFGAGFLKWVYPKKTHRFFWVRARVSEPCVQQTYILHSTYIIHSMFNIHGHRPASVPSTRQHPGDCLEVKREYCQNCSVLCLWHNAHSQQHTYMSSSYRSSWLGLSHWDPYAVHRGGCLELHYCNMVEWCWWYSSLIWKTNRFPSVLWNCWFSHMTCKNRPRYDL